MRRCYRSCWRAGERAAPVSSEQPAKAGVVWLPRCLQIAHVSLHSVLGSPSWPAAAAAAAKQALRWCCPTELQRPPLPAARRIAACASQKPVSFVTLHPCLTQAVPQGWSW